jgi:hypothetical protein
MPVGDRSSYSPLTKGAKAAGLCGGMRKRDGRLDSGPGFHRGDVLSPE